MANLAALRDRLELILSIPQGDSFVDSSSELDDINEAYRKTAYTWDWPQLLIKRGARVLANQRKYSLPSVFRKFRSLFVLDQEYEEVEHQSVNVMDGSYAVDLETSEFIINSVPGSNGAEYTLTNAESAGQTVTIELNSVSGLAAGDEIVFPDDTNPEVTYVASVDSSLNTITARLKTSKSSGAVMYKGSDNIMYNYYRTITALSDAADSPLLPSDVHYAMLYYAAFLAYTRLEQFDRAEKALAYWKEQTDDYFRAFDKGSTGAVTQFSIA